MKWAESRGIQDELGMKIGGNKQSMMNITTPRVNERDVRNE